MKKFLFFLIFCVFGGIIYFLACGPDPVSNDDKDITGTISGTVTDTSGKVLSGVSITTDTGGYTSVTDTVGHYTIPYVKAGTYSLTFTKEDYADTTVGGVTIAKTEDVININMQMRYIPPFGTISGNVTDTSGVPLSGVSATTDSGGFTSVTDTLGNYTIPNVTPGTYSLTFTNVTYADTTVDSVTVTAGQNTVGINARMRYLPQVGTISGNVTDTSGIALSGVSVTTDSGGFTSVTDTLGNYTIPNVAPGTYSLTFTATFYADTTVDSVTVTKGVDIPGINAKMRHLPQVGTISGNVTDTSGIALSGVSVTTDSGGFTSVTDTLGNYTIPSVDPGIYSLTFTATFYADTTVDSVTVTKGEDVTGINVKMRYTPAYGAVFGIVCDSATDAPWPNVPILVSPVGLTGNSNANGEYLITQVPVDTYSVAAYSTYHSNTISNVIVIENDTTYITDTIWSVPNNLEEHDIYGNLTGNLSDIAGVTATVTGDSIPEDNPIITSLSWLPVSEQYTGFVYVPQEGLLWDVEVKVFDSNDRVTGYQKMAFDAGVGDIAMPSFDAWNAKPIALASSIQSEVSIKDSINLKGSGLDTVYGTGIAKWEWDIGNTGNFILTSTSDSTIYAPSTEDSNFTAVLRVTDDDGNTDLDSHKIVVVQDAPIANATIQQSNVYIGETINLQGTADNKYGTITKWEWKIGDSSWVETSSGDTNIIAPPKAQTLICSLRVTDDDGNVGWDHDNVNVKIFLLHTISSEPGTMLSVYAIDVDSDGDNDLVSAYMSPDKIGWYENDGDENFTAHTIPSCGSTLVSVFAIDVDKDGDVDFLSGSNQDDTLALYLNDGAENFTPQVISDSASGIHSVFAIDVNADGNVDILTASINSDKISWYENDGNANFTTHVITSSVDAPRSVYAIDIDGDNDIDVLSASQADNKIAWYENDGAESFTPHDITTSAGGARSVYAIDINGDGDIDVLSAYANNIEWYENDGNENFTTYDITTSLNTAWSSYAIDIDSDGDIDVLSGSVDDDKLAWYENDGSENFTAHIISTSDKGRSLFAIDIDGDGDVDVVSISSIDHLIVWYENLLY